ncbi:hypothetical protein [Sphingomonas beigongshangi]|uniref:hypothetical protein n=1 Tax=Sphingomonas beigongshangi TaxID=2782540 RepID=UPI001AEE81A1|nr:hypothetical protein [Sphingomonas beigongshangi]
MQQSHIPTREQADASFARFLADLGHHDDPLNVSTMPRLSGAAVHETLGATVTRLRAHEAAASAYRPAPRPLRMKVRLARRRWIDTADRAFNAATTCAVIGISGYVILPALTALLMGAL